MPKTLTKRRYTVNPANKPGPHKPWKYTKENIEELADSLLAWSYGDPTGNLFLEKWAYENYLTPQRISELAGDERFSEALELVKMNQKFQLMDGGLNGAFNALITKLLLMSNHGMAEKTDTTVRQHIDKDIDELLDKEYGE